MIDFDVAYEKLASLDSADDIAGLMMQYGVKANPGEARSCAITVWMEEQTGLNITTGSRSVRVVKQIGINPWDYDETGIVRDHTGALIEFIRKFDTYEYPELMY